ncbi:MAG: RNA methyltransferase [Burkholderiales bacterium]|nr:RNA methyltransferase [Burkholderiales bacterium]
MLEGPHLVEAALSSGRNLRALVVAERALEDPALARLAERARVPVTMVADRLLRAIAHAETPQGILAEIALPAETPDLRTVRSCVFLDAVQDAGNVGAILRSAAAFGIEAAVLGPGCADPWAPKVLRAAMGAHFALALCTNAALGPALEAFGARIVCALPRGGVPLRRADLAGRLGWLFGAEGRGVDPALAARAHLRVTIPLHEAAESLNVAAAAAICFYEAASRQ